MHSTDYKDVTFLHNGDYSGDVIVVLPAETSEMELDHQSHTVSVRVPYEALEYLITTKLAGQFVSHLEDVQNMNELFDGLGIRLVTIKTGGDVARYGFVRSLANLDAGDNPERRSIRLQDIIDQAKELLK